MILAYNTNGGHKEWVEAACNSINTALGRMRIDQGFVTCCERMLADERMRSVWPDLEIDLARACADLGVTLARSGRIAEGRPYLRRSVQLRWTLRSITLYGMTYSPRLLKHRHLVPRTTATGASVLAMASATKSTMPGTK